MANLRIQIIDSELEFLHLRTLWLKLLNTVPQHTIFLHPDWLECWWHIYGSQSRLLVIAVWDEQELVGLAPFYIAQNRWGFRILKWLGSNEICSDYLQILVPPQRCDEILSRIFQTLLDLKENWDGLDWTDIPEEVDVAYFSALNSASRLKNFQLSPHTVCPYLPLPSSWEQQLARLSPGMRKTVNHKWNRLHRLFSVRFVEVKKAEQIMPELNNLISLHQKRWQRQRLNGSFASPNFRRFHQEVAQRFYQHGCLRLITLYLNERPVAGLYGFAYRQRFYLYQMGMDPICAENSVGLVLLTQTIRQAIAEGLQEFDFLRGDAEYKRRWRSQRRMNYRLQGYNPGFKNEMRAKMLHAVLAGKTNLKKVIPANLWVGVRHLVNKNY